MLTLGAVAFHSLEAAWNDWSWPALALCVLGWLLLIASPGGAAADPRRMRRIDAAIVRFRWTVWRARRAHRRLVAEIARRRGHRRAAAAAPIEAATRRRRNPDQPQ